MIAQTSTPQDPIQLSQDFLLAAKLGRTTESYQATLAALPPTELHMALRTDVTSSAFWINTYNALVLSSLRDEPSLYDKKRSFFKKRRYLVAGYNISLDDIEHGVLRRSKVKLSQGYLNKWFPSGFERMFRVQRPDYRIHFALNCGAKSCPPIAFYKSEKLSAQLALAEANFLKGTCSYDPAHNELRVSKIFYWFAADFGGRKGVLQLAKNHGIVPPEAIPKLKYDPYDYTLALPASE